MLGGCGSEEEEQDNLVIIDQPQEEQRYTLVAAAVGDVVLTEQFPCSYQQVKREDIGFAVSGKQISEVYVSLGDQVKKGQLLAELGDEEISGRMEELEYQIERNRILLDQIPLTRDYEISTAWLQFIYRSGQSEEERENLEKSVKQIEQRYRYAQEEYEDEIYLDNLELEKLRQETADSKIYAGIDGVVSWVKPGLKGSLSIQEDPVIRLTDSSECLFAVNGTKGKELFAEGVPVDMTIFSGDFKGDYRLIPYQMESWEDKMLFSLADGGDTAIEVGTNGTIRILLDKRENVLYVPKSSVHLADGRAFVYCLGDGNIREVKWVETGLYGNDSVEIISGLQEGDKIIQ